MKTDDESMLRTKRRRQFLQSHNVALLTLEADEVGGRVGYGGIRQYLQSAPDLPLSRENSILSPPPPHISPVLTHPVG